VKNMTTAFDISVVLFEDGDWWCAQCLEYDISAQAKSLPELRYELERVLFSHVCAGVQEGREPFEGLGKAPKKFWQMYASADLRVEADDLVFSTPTPDAVPPVIAKMKVAELMADFS